MAWERVRMWHWALVAAAIGFGVGTYRAGRAPDVVRDLGESLNGQRQFEEALFRAVQGHRRFENVVVTPERLDLDGKGPRLAYVVAGDYWDGRREVDGNGAARQATFRPAFFVAPFPYKPIVDLAPLAKDAPDAAARFKAIAEPTVLDFLALARDARGVQFRHAWWRGSAHAVWMWTLGCTLIGGLVMPLAVNLTTFGTIWRPHVPKRAIADLSKVKPRAAAERKPVATADDFAKLEDLDRQLADKLTAGATAEPKPAQAPAAATAVARPLSTKPLEAAVVAPAAAARSKAFGTEDDDFYPTERHAKAK